MATKTPPVSAQLPQPMEAYPVSTTREIFNAVMSRLLTQTRYRVAALAGLAVLLALITLFQAVRAYDVSYDLFRGIVEVNSTTVDASEQALQSIAQASQAAADYTLLNSDTPLFEESQNNIFRSFSSFRNEMARLNANLQTESEREVFLVAETMTYSRFWRHVSTLVAQRTNDEVARREYLEADNHVRSWINPALEELETLNFEQMEAAGSSAGNIIQMQLLLYVLPALALAGVLTYLSFQLRGKVRRYLTPGIDGAMVLSFVALFVIAGNLIGAPNQLRLMIDSAYRSVSASSRTLVDANLSNRAESSALVDLARADAWNERFNEAAERIELRLCGRQDCTSSTFLVSSDRLSATTLNNAAIDEAEIARINGLPPLVSNVTFPGEAAALENARLAYLDFMTAHNTLNTMIDAGQMEEAVLFNTSSEAGTSQEAFERLSTAMDQLSVINRDVFDETWNSQRALLQNSQLMFGFLAYALVIGLVILGTWHRFREL